jgi:hypothetical protein
MLTVPYHLFEQQLPLEALSVGFSSLFELVIFIIPCDMKGIAEWILDSTVRALTCGLNAPYIANSGAPSVFAA